MKLTNSLRKTLKLNNLTGQGTEQSIESLAWYLMYALPPGGFMSALLKNSPIVEVVRRGDIENCKRTHYYIDWLINHAPDECWGSDEKVNAWLNKSPEFLKFSEEILKQQTWEIISD